MRREIPLLSEVSLSSTKLKHIHSKRRYGTIVNVRLLNIIPVLLIELYQKVTVDRPHVCNMRPSCSEYARLAYLRYGFFAASFLTIERLLECSDFDTLWPKENKP